MGNTFCQASEIFFVIFLVVGISVVFLTIAVNRHFNIALVSTLYACEDVLTVDTLP